ncbi:hypothetical protein IEQ34_020773 [Dendrobium chrysotoxum]|uniref:Uncharacterized protein n=1 Tax=Dendrobium chrysotoxum TaxID=161865 RepID=A0AAV7G1V8_DENCH|nr:hypothetical protein IEQ34_020773 [Dendrobium chrysotoxum]
MSAIEEHHISGRWRIIGHPPTSSPPANFSLIKTLEYLQIFICTTFVEIFRFSFFQMVGVPRSSANSAHIYNATSAWTKSSWMALAISNALELPAGQGESCTFLSLVYVDVIVEGKELSFPQGILISG